jgi:hypothetical protein
MAAKKPSKSSRSTKKSRTKVKDLPANRATSVKGGVGEQRH